MTYIPISKPLKELLSKQVVLLLFLKENVVFVHAVKKKTNEIPGNDIALSLKRKKYIEKYQTNMVKEENDEN
ncbi:MAG: hypothetical protein M1467_03875 [Deltaproteobacteria bacterium]|nr:hypothetical protein [Deltaproteobacteria bacterium]